MHTRSSYVDVDVIDFAIAPPELFLSPQRCCHLQQEATHYSNNNNSLLRH